MIVKSVTLPKFTIDHKIRSAYGRKNITQNKISYDPVSLVFHDDQADVIRNFWYDYYSFYYRDSDYADATYQGIHKYQSRPSFDWGYTPRPTVGYNNSNSNQPYQYIQAIRIYSMYQKNFSEYELINPMISSFKHGDHASAGTTEPMRHDMTIQYESVKYLTGYVTENNVGGFIDLHYDTVPSPIAPLNGTKLVDNGQGGYAQATDNITDLAGVNPLYGAIPVQTAIQALAGSGGISNALAAATSSGGSNFGGFSIPNLGSLTAGITNSAILSQQLQAAGAALVGTAASTLANGIIGGVAAGLGSQGTSIISLAAQVIANPTLALKTVINMATTYATGLVTNYVSNNIIAPLTNTLAGYATKFGQQIADNFINPITGSISSAFGEIGSSINFFTNTYINPILNPVPDFANTLTEFSPQAYISIDP